MASKKISALTAAGSVALSDYVPCVVSGPTTKSATFTVIRAALLPIVLTADVSGTLPVANGGTGLTARGSALQYLRTTGSGSALEWATLPTFPAGTIVGTSDSQTLTGKVISGASNTLTVRLGSDVSGVLPIANGGTGNSGAAVAVSALDIDWTLGTVFTKTLAAGSNTFTFSNVSSGMSILVRLTGSASTVVWPNSGANAVKWPGGVAPTQTASGRDVYSFFHDGSSIYGNVVQNFS